jgi:type IV secretion system protein VirB9
MNRITRRRLATAMLCCAGAVAGCATHKPPTIAFDDPATMQPAVLQAPPKAPDVAPLPSPVPMPLPGQLKLVDVSAAPSRPPEAADPRARVVEANDAARVQPTRAGYINAVQVYPFAEGALYQVYAAPGEVTDIALEAGEQLVGSGPVAAGDTVRWIIGDTESGAGATRRVHILLKPTAPDLATNLVIDTDKRTYHLELRSGPKAYMASVSWTYPADQLIAVRHEAAAAQEAAPVETGLDVTHLKFRYRIEGDKPPWRPLLAFDDGRRVYIEMPPGLAQGDAPPLFVVGAGGKGELVNYRVDRNYYVVDRLFGAAELRLGGKHQQTVRIVRSDSGRAS